MNKNIAIIMKLVLFIICISLIIWGQKTVSYLNLGAQLVGLTGLLTLLYTYNKTYR